MKNLASSCLTLLLLAGPAFAEVTAKGATGFNLRITGEVNVSPATAYEQFLKVEQWWLSSHTWYGKSENLRINAEAGGCFCEISGDNQVQHMMVTYVQPGVELKMVGGLGPLQMMGLHGGMSWRFEPHEGGTRIVQSYNVTGWAPGGLEDIADIVDSVQTDQLNALIQQLENPQ